MKTTQKEQHFNQLLEKLILWCEKQIKNDRHIDQQTRFESLKSEWKNRLTLWDEINPFVKATLNITDLYPDEFAIRGTVGDLCNKLVQKAEQPVTADNEKDSLKNGFSPIPAEERVDQPTVLILSSPRSGSTLLRTMLTGHSELNAPPELHLLGYSDLKTRERRMVDKGKIWMLSGLMQTIASQMHMSEDEAFALLSKLTVRELPIHRVYKLIHSSSSKSILIDKSPSILRENASLLHTKQMFKEPKYIHLIRHPGAVIESMERMRHIILPHLSENFKDRFSRLKEAEKIWRNYNINALNFLPTIPNKQHIKVLYENLVHDPRTEMKSIAQFIGVEYEDAMLDPYSGDRLISGIGDPNISSHDKVDPKLAESWRENLGDYSFDNETIELADQLGITI